MARLIATCLRKKPAGDRCNCLIKQTGPGRWECSNGHVWYGESEGALRSEPWPDQRSSETHMGDFEDRVGTSEEGQQALFDMSDLPDAKQQRVKELGEWLGRLKDREQTETLRKAAQYGSSDLEVMAKAMLMLVPEERRDQRLGLQMAIAFYCLGKIARLFGAFEDGRAPDADTWYDLHVYGMMGLRVWEEGKWL